MNKNIIQLTARDAEMIHDALEGKEPIKGQEAYRILALLYPEKWHVKDEERPIPDADGRGYHGQETQRMIDEGNVHLERKGEEVLLNDQEEVDD